MNCRVWLHSSLHVPAMDRVHRICWPSGMAVQCKALHALGKLPMATGTTACSLGSKIARAEQAVCWRSLRAAATACPRPLHAWVTPYAHHA